jgi:hypothetical protein
MDLQLKDTEPPARRTLTASPAMKARIEKVAPPPPKPSAQHAVHKPLEKPPITQPKPVPTQKATVIEERAATRDPAGLERRNALFMKLRQLSPALFAAKKPVLMAVGTYDVIVDHLGLDPRGRARFARRAGLAYGRLSVSAGAFSRRRGALLPRRAAGRRGDRGATGNGGEEGRAA